jgi:hypothetical protein
VPQAPAAPVRRADGREEAASSRALEPGVAPRVELGVTTRPGALLAQETAADILDAPPLTGGGRSGPEH